MKNDNNVIKNLQEKIRKLEATLQIVTSHSGQTETRLREQFEVVSETIPVPMIISEENGEIVFANLNAQKTFGYSSEDFAGVETRSLYDNPEQFKSFLEILSEEGEVSGFRVELRKPEDTVFPAVLFSHRIYFDGQNCILTVVHDLTEIMFLEKQLRQTQKLEAIGTLTSGIAHDFNNTLTVISGYTELTEALLDPEKDDGKKKYLNNVQKASNRAKSMIMQMMAFCRQVEQKKKSFHISSITAEVVEMMNNLTPSDIDVSSDIRDKDMIVSGDPTQTHQVVANLITNAVHALSEKGGMIEIFLKEVDVAAEQRNEMLISKLEPGKYAKITVKDNGPGIDRNIVHNIFDPFFTTKPVGKGSGMGLAVVHGIVLGNKGSISVESEPEKGSAFHCYFPVSEKYDETAISDIKKRRVGKGTENILLVDDESMILEINVQILETMGYKVSSSTSSMNALEMFKIRPENFDLIVTDNLMPEMSGFEMVEEIVKIRPDIPVIMISGTLSKSDIELKKAGITTTIQKPYNGREIQAVVWEVLDAAKNEK